MTFLSYITVLLGLVSLSLSAAMGLYFIRSQSRIARAVSYMLIGEAFVSFVTVLFSVFAMGVYDCMGPILAMVMRWAMFAVASATSIHLAYQVRMIELRGVLDHGKESEDGPE